MAGETFTLTVDLKNHLWILLKELADSTPAGSWVLVGGAMVQLHALRAGIGPMRLTRDIDALLDLSVSGIGSVAGAIQAMGFEPQIPNWAGGFHRFRRSDEVIDILASRNVRAPVRWGGHEVLKVAGATQAIQRKDTYILTDGNQNFAVGVPDSVGAIIAKSAAHKVDRVNRERHLRDLVSLLASSPQGEFEQTDLSKKEKQYLRHLTNKIGNRLQPWWLGFSPVQLGIAEANLESIQSRV